MHGRVLNPPVRVSTQRSEWAMLAIAPSHSGEHKARAYSVSANSPASAPGEALDNISVKMYVSNRFARGHYPAGAR